QKEASWGDNIIADISIDLKKEFPNMKGFSKRNIFYMKQWYLFFSKVQQVVAQLEDEVQKNKLNQIFKIPWGHNIVIITKIKDSNEALFYTQKTVENGWSRSVLVHQMESRLYQREGKAITNFDNKLPSPQSDLAKAILKDPYSFDFLTLTHKHIQKIIKKYFGESQIYLFGSRLKQELKGGDIDIFIIPQNRDNLTQKSAKTKFWLEESLFKPIDILVHQNFDREIEKEALKGIKI
ncbi:MAG TPA: DUF1016 family protein, partial [Bacteroidetes bacterium]|nr:DUF1016 family protein [Bacteroidota bacterium]